MPCFDASSFAAVSAPLRADRKIGLARALRDHRDPQTRSAGRCGCWRRARSSARCRIRSASPRSSSRTVRSSAWSSSLPPANCRSSAETSSQRAHRTRAVKGRPVAFSRHHLTCTNWPTTARQPSGFPSTMRRPRLPTLHVSGQQDIGSIFRCRARAVGARSSPGRCAARSGRRTRASQAGRPSTVTGRMGRRAPIAHVEPMKRRPRADTPACDLSTIGRSNVSRRRRSVGLGAATPTSWPSRRPRCGALSTSGTASRITDVEEPGVSTRLHSRSSAELRARRGTPRRQGSPARDAHPRRR